MRVKKPYLECKHCGQVPIQLILFDRVYNNRRFYRCGLCKSTIRSEEITVRDICSGNIHDENFEGTKTLYGYRYSGIGK